jgi:hypothetical protein
MKKGKGSGAGFGCESERPKNTAGTLLEVIEKICGQIIKFYKMEFL